MKKINLAVTGCMGRMGQQIIKSIKHNKNFKLVALTENRKINKKINGVQVNLNSEKELKKEMMYGTPMKKKKKMTGVKSYMKKPVRGAKKTMMKKKTK